MQVMLNIPDEIPQEVVNKLLMQFEKQIQTVKKSVLKLPQANNDVDKAKARQNLAQLLNKLRIITENEINQSTDKTKLKMEWLDFHKDLSNEEPDISEEEIIALVKEVRAELYAKQ